MTTTSNALNITYPFSATDIKLTPTITVYVNSYIGVDAIGNGTVLSPYLTISYALSQITDNSSSKIYLVNSFGAFVESSLAFKPYVFHNFNNGSLQVSSTVTLDSSFSTGGFLNINNIQGADFDMTLDFEGVGAPNAVVQINNILSSAAATWTIQGNPDPNSTVVVIENIKGFASFMDLVINDCYGGGGGGDIGNLTITCTAGTRNVNIQQLEIIGDLSVTASMTGALNYIMDCSKVIGNATYNMTDTANMTLIVTDTVYYAGGFSAQPIINNTTFNPLVFVYDKLQWEPVILAGAVEYIPLSNLTILNSGSNPIVIRDSTGGPSEDTNSLMRMSSTTRSSAPWPIMNNAQMLAIPFPQIGDCVFNTDTSQLYMYNLQDGASWDPVGVVSSPEHIYVNSLLGSDSTATGTPWSPFGSYNAAAAYANFLTNPGNPCTVVVVGSVPADNSFGANMVIYPFVNICGIGSAAGNSVYTSGGQMVLDASWATASSPSMEINGVWLTIDNGININFADSITNQKILFNEVDFTGCASVSAFIPGVSGSTYAFIDMANCTGFNTDPPLSGVGPSPYPAFTFENIQTKITNSPAISSITVTSSSTVYSCGLLLEGGVDVTLVLNGTASFFSAADIQNSNIVSLTLSGINASAGLDAASYTVQPTLTSGAIIGNVGGTCLTDGLTNTSFVPSNYTPTGGSTFSANSLTGNLAGIDAALLGGVTPGYPFTFTLDSGNTSNAHSIASSGGIYQVFGDYVTLYMNISFVPDTMSPTIAFTAPLVTSFPLALVVYPLGNLYTNTLAGAGALLFSANLPGTTSIQLNMQTGTISESYTGVFSICYQYQGF